MYDLNNSMKRFYRKHVVLPRKDQSELNDKKRINLKRLKDGLALYNDLNNTDYKIVDTVVQGSMAMSTITQNDSKEYDIDVAIILDRDKIPEGNTRTKNIIVNSLGLKTEQFSKQPELKTNCIRLEYTSGYHIDFAIYRKFLEGSNYQYEHCGSIWRPRDPWALNNWFKEENKKNHHNLIRIVRLIKMFCKSRNSWIMPGGMILTVLVQLNYVHDDRLDKSFILTLENIFSWLQKNPDIMNPVESGISLLQVAEDNTKIDNLKKRLETYLNKSAVLYNTNCSQEEAIDFWNDFFNHSFWTEELSKSIITENFSYSILDSTRTNSYDDTEELIDEYFEYDVDYALQIECEVKQDGFRTMLLRSMLSNNIPLRTSKKLRFYIKRNDVPPPYEVYWKVRNIGDKAKRRNCIRGQILKDSGREERIESTNFFGPHYVECYIIKEYKCVAVDKIDVPIK